MKLDVSFNDAIKNIVADGDKKLIPGAEVLGISTITLRNINWQVSELWLVENETTLYMLPTRPDAIAICSKGYALSELKNIPLFEKSPLYYWGDMNEDGFNLLSMCRQMYANTQSVFMDENSFLSHEKEMDKQPAIYRKQELPVLKDHEKRAFNSLKEYNGRIEQEKLQLSFVEQIISMLK